MENEVIAPQNMRQSQPLKAYYRELAQVGLEEANKPDPNDPEGRTKIQVLMESLMDAAIGKDGRKPDLKAADLFFKYVFGVPQVKSRRDLTLIIAAASHQLGTSVYDDPILSGILRLVASGEDSSESADRRAGDDRARAHQSIIEAADGEVGSEELP